MADVFDYELWDYLDDQLHECYNCGQLIDEDKEYCSRECYNESEN